MARQFAPVAPPSPFFPSDRGCEFPAMIQLPVGLSCLRISCSLLFREGVWAGIGVGTAGVLAVLFFLLLSVLLVFCGLGAAVSSPFLSSRRGAYGGSAVCASEDFAVCSSRPRSAPRGAGSSAGASASVAIPYSATSNYVVIRPRFTLLSERRPAVRPEGCIERCSRSMAAGLGSLWQVADSYAPLFMRVRESSDSRGRRSPVGTPVRAAFVRSVGRQAKEEKKRNKTGNPRPQKKKRPSQVQSARGSCLAF